MKNKLSDSAVTFISPGFEMNEMSLFVVAIDFSRSISGSSFLLQTRQHAGKVTCSETEVRPRGGIVPV